MSTPAKPRDILDSGYIQPGTQIGFYTVETRLGAGGFGSVYLVLRDGKPYALKLSQARLSDVAPDDRRHMEDRVNREVSALNSLRHPNIVRVHGFERWPDMDGFQFIVMDHVEGVPLLKWVRQAKPSAYRLLGVFKKIALALQEMHRLEVFHRDLKSSNVLVREDGEPVIVDFGLARPRSAYTVTRADWLLGTISHFAPEYVEYIGSEEYRSGKTRFVWRPTTDLYALGVVLYEALTGQEPHSGDDEGELLAHIRRVIPTLPSKLNTALPGAVDALAMRLLAKKPAERHQSGEELATEIDLLLTRAETKDGAWTAPLGLTGKAAAKGPTAGAPASNGAPVVDPNAETRIKIKPVAQAKSVDVPLESLAAAEEPALAQPLSFEKPGEPNAGQHPGADGVVLPAVDGKSFVAPEPAPAATPKASSARPALSAQMRGAAEKLEAARTTGRPKRNWVLPGVLGLLALVALALVWANQLVQSKKAQPVDLLAQVEKGEGSSAAKDSPAKQEGPAENAHVPPLPPAAAHPIGARNEASVLPSLGSKAENEDERAIHALAKSSFRPRIPGPGESKGASEQPGQPSPFATVRRVDGKASDSAVRKFNIPLGTHIRVRLMSNLDSRTDNDAPAEAKLLRTFYLKGESKLPSGAMFYGDWRASQGRFSVRFTKLVLPDRTEVPISAVAIDGEDRKAGLKAGRTITVEQPKGDGTATKVGKATANVLLGTLPGDTPGQVAQRAGQTVLDGSGNAGSAGQSAALLDSGVDFDLFVKESF